MHPENLRVHHVYSERSGNNTRTQRQLHSGSPRSMQVSAMTILLKQLVSMLQLQLTQPHILTTFITHKWCQVFQFTILFPVSLNTIYFISASPSISIGSTSAWMPLSYQSRSSKTWNTLCMPCKTAQEDKYRLYAVLSIHWVTMNRPTNLSLIFWVLWSRRLRVNNKTLAPTSNSACCCLVSAYFFWYY